jgi:hypothetical protein
LAQLQRIRNDFQPVIEHASRPCVMMAVGSGDFLHQLGISFDWRKVEHIELRPGNGCALPNMFQQPFAAGSSEQYRRRMGMRQPHGNGSLQRGGENRRGCAVIVLEQPQALHALCTLSRIDPFPLPPFPSHPLPPFLFALPL